SRLVVANTGLPTGEQPMPKIWWRFREVIQGQPDLNIGWFIQGACCTQMSDEVRAAYDAPFPDDTYCVGPRAMPGLVPTSPGDPAAAANKSAWTKLSVSPTPILVAFSDSDPFTGAMGIDHPLLRGAGHFLQEDAGEELANHIVEFLRR